ncbi:MAG: HlyD family efflux transporter periplasmic adaptor subunit [Lentisphaerae bacterium]|nr:HlyD family efflux transporter periplasmic adaptor subunit [Lentisphaerota bacterium]
MAVIKKVIIILAVLSCVLLAVNFYLNYRKNAIYRNPAFAYGNGRLEATEISISTKLPGRIEAIYVNDGDFVTKGQLLALMQTDVLEAELAQAQARKEQSEATLTAAQAAVSLRQSEYESALAVVRQKESACDGAKKRYDRAVILRQDAAMSQQDFEVDETYYQTCTAELSAARAAARKAQAAIAAAQAEVSGAQAAITAAGADIARIQADLSDCRLTAPVDGRIQYRIAQTGEVLAAGGKVLNLVDLSDVYMTFFLSEASAGKVKIGSPVRLVLDAAPERPIPATVYFVSSVAQFTPKTVETAEERQKLMFRVKARIDPELLRRHLAAVKTGLPGVAWVKLDENEPWPQFLRAESEK